MCVCVCVCVCTLYFLLLHCEYQGKDEYLGSSTVTPTMRLDRDLKGRKLPRLAWYDIKRYHRNAGEVLAAFELMLIVSGCL